MTDVAQLEWPAPRDPGILTRKQQAVLIAIVIEAEHVMRRGGDAQRSLRRGETVWLPGGTWRHWTRIDHEPWHPGRCTTDSFKRIAGSLRRRGLLDGDHWSHQFWPNVATFKQLERRVPVWVQRIDQRGHVHPPLEKATGAEWDAVERMLAVLAEEKVYLEGYYAPDEEPAPNSTKNLLLKLLRVGQTNAGAVV